MHASAYAEEITMLDFTNALVRRAIGGVRSS
jgi:hypothetical protein